MFLKFDLKPYFGHATLQRKNVLIAEKANNGSLSLLYQHHTSQDTGSYGFPTGDPNQWPYHPAKTQFSTHLTIRGYQSPASWPQRDHCIVAFEPRQEKRKPSRWPRRIAFGSPRLQVTNKSRKGRGKLKRKIKKKCRREAVVTYFPPHYAAAWLQ